MIHVVMMVGGSGTRLWPRSRAARPKQLMRIGGDENLMRETLKRAQAVTWNENILVVTTGDLEQMCRREMPELPESNIIVEPQRRDTAAAVGLGAVHVAARDPDGVMVVLPADHVIRPTDGFARVMRAAAEVAGARRSIVTTGIVPRSPSTGYGYIQRGEKVDEVDGVPAYKQIRFREKPDTETARQFVEQGDHYWNSGIFTWRADTILEAFKKYAPDHDRLLGEIAAAIGTPQEKEIVERAYGHMPRISVDYAIMEHVEDVVTVEADFHWDDVGSWSAVGPHLPKDDNGNAVDGKFVGLDSENNVVLSHTGRVITTVGVEDMVIVDDGDVVFVCPKGRDQDVKKMVEYLRDHNMEHLL